MIHLGEAIFNCVEVIKMITSNRNENTPSNCSGWPLEGAWHLQNSTENAEPACHKIVWNDQIQAKVPGT